MHARVNTTQVEPDQMDELVDATQPLLSRAKPQAPGPKSVMLLGDRRTGKIVIVSRWESEAAGDAAESLYQEAMLMTESVTST